MNILVNRRPESDSGRHYHILPYNLKDAAKLDELNKLIEAHEKEENKYNE